MLLSCPLTHNPAENGIMIAAGHCNRHKMPEIDGG
jgi:hypothetical protein